MSEKNSTLSVSIYAVLTRPETGQIKTYAFIIDQASGQDG